jgi:hypothetical protein
MVAVATSTVSPKSLARAIERARENQCPQVLFVGDDNRMKVMDWVPLASRIIDKENIRLIVETDGHISYS